MRLHCRGVLHEQVWQCLATLGVDRVLIVGQTLAALSLSLDALFIINRMSHSICQLPTEELYPYAHLSDCRIEVGHN